MTFAHKLPVLTTSSERAYRTCQKLYLYRYRYGYRGKVRPSYFTFGTAVHQLLECWYTGYLKGADLPAEWPSPDEEARGMAMMDAYMRHYGDPKAGEGWEVLATEKEFSMPNSAYVLAGKIDMLIRDKAGGVWLVEHKTAASAPNVDRLPMDPQLLNYILAAESGCMTEDFLDDVKGVIYNVIIKPKLKRKKEESIPDFRSRIYSLMVLEPESYFVRHKVEKSGHLLANGRRLNSDISEAMAMSARHGLYPQNPYACHGYGFTCEFYSVCQGKLTLEEDLTLERSEVEHPELTGTF